MISTTVTDSTKGAKKFYFMRSILEGTQIRVKFLPGQFYTNFLGKESLLDHEMQVKVSKEIKHSMPIGEILITDSLTQNVSYYDVGYITSYNFYTTIPQASIDMRLEYDKFMGTPKVTTKNKKDSIPRTLLSGLKKNPEYVTPKIEDGFYVDEEMWYLLIRNIKQLQPTLLLGPKGSGKTSLPKLLAKRLNMGFYYEDMGSMEDISSGLLGTHRIENGSSIFDYSDFVKAIQKPSIVLIDEANRSPSEANNMLFPLLDERRTLSVSIAPADMERSIKAHEDCVFFGSANIGSSYVGTRMLDAAFMDRFFVVELGYPPKEIESQLLQVRAKIDAYHSDLVVSICNDIRTANRQGNLQSSVSVRHSLEISKLIKDGFPIISAIKAVVLPLFEDGDETSERAVVMGMVSSR